MTSAADEERERPRGGRRGLFGFRRRSRAETGVGRADAAAEQRAPSQTHDEPPIVVAPLMPLPCDITAYLSPLIRGFQRDVVVLPVEVNLSGAYDPERDQYLSSFLLRELIAARPAGSDCVVGVVDVDLFVPVLTYVFGEAQLGGVAAVVSTFRLREPWFRGGASPEVLRGRLAKTLLHEVGHIRGLRHCADPGCVMTSASSIEMLDEKGETLCLECQARVV